MESKTSYIEKNEIKVKNLLSEMYQNESGVLSRIRKKKDHLEVLNSEIKELENDYRNQKNLREELTAKFDDLQKSGSDGWENFRQEYEMILNFAEGDKNSFILTAEVFMEELNKRILEMEESVKESSSEIRKKSQEMLQELNERRNALQSRLEEAKEDTGELWKEIKQWFIERANSVKALF